MLDHAAQMSVSVLVAQAANNPNVMVAIVVAAIGAVAALTVGLLNFRTQGRVYKLQKVQQERQEEQQTAQQEWQEEQQDRQLQLLKSTQITDRFTNAINQLGSHDKAVRIGGIFALEQIARDSPHDQDRPNIAYTLAAFIRQSQPAPADRKQSYVPVLKARAPDVQAALTVLCRSPLCDYRSNASSNDLADLRRTDLRLDLSRTDLRRASLSDAHLEAVNLWSARLEGANLRGAHLQGTGLSGAYLGRCHPKYEHGADLSDADLRGAFLTRVRDLHVAKTTDGTLGLPK
jgi:hypothetical protein